MGTEPEIVALIERAKEVLGDEELAHHWLETPKKALGGQTPLETTKSKEGLGSVDALLGRIEHGVFS